MRKESVINFKCFVAFFFVNLGCALPSMAMYTCSGLSEMATESLFICDSSGTATTPVVTTVYPFYPNPTTGIFHLSYESTGDWQIEIRVIDVKGVEAAREWIQICAGEHTIDFTSIKLLPGIYYAVFMNEGKIDEKLKLLVI